MTVAFCMCLTDLGALVIFLGYCSPQPLAAVPGGSALPTLSGLEAVVGTWDCALVASVALQAAVCASVWRVYRALREQGVYPPGAKPAGAGPILEVSCLEVVCEAED